MMYFQRRNEILRIKKVIVDMSDTESWTFWSHASLSKDDGSGMSCVKVAQVLIVQF